MLGPCGSPRVPGGPRPVCVHRGRGRRVPATVPAQVRPRPFTHSSSVPRRRGAGPAARPDLPFYAPRRTVLYKLPRLRTLLAACTAVMAAAALPPPTLHAQRGCSFTDCADVTPPTITFSPASGSQTGTTLSVTITWRDTGGGTLSMVDRSIQVDGVDNTTQWTYSGTTTLATSTGTVTLRAGAVTTVTATISDSYGNQTTESATYTLAASYGMTIVPGATSVQRPTGTAAAETFVITNTGNVADGFVLSPTCTGTAVSSCSLSAPSPVTIAAGASATVAINYRVSTSNAQTGTVALQATGTGASGSSSTAVTTVFQGKNGSVNNVSAEARLDRGDCLTVATGDAMAYQCGDLRVVAGVPGVRTLNQARAPTLLYNSQVASPTVVVAHSYAPPAGATPTSVKMELFRGPALGVAGSMVLAASSTFPGWAAGVARRIAVSFDASSLPTAVYPYNVVFTSTYADGSTSVSSINAMTVPVVNRGDAANPWGKGWWLTGLEQLYPQADGSFLWVAGDGSPRHYKTVSTTAWAASPYTYPDTLRLVAGEYVRTLPGRGEVHFDAVGHHVATLNKLGHRTGLDWTSGKMTALHVPGGGDFLFTYNGCNGLIGTITSPGSRITTVANDCAGRITSVTAPGLPAVAFGYADASPRIASRTDRRGYRTDFRYDAANRLSSVKRWLNTSATGDSVVTRFRAQESQGLPSTGGSVDMAQLYTRIDGPRIDAGDTTLFVIDRWGAPASITNAAGLTTTLSRNDGRWPGRTTRVLYPGGREVTAEYDARGNVVAETDWSRQRNGRYATTLYEWDLTWDLPTRITHPEGEVELTAYDAYGRPQWTQKGPSAATRTVVQYLPLTHATAPGMVQSVQAPLTTAEQFEYDAAGNLSAVVSPRGNRVEYLNDALGRTIRTRSALQSGLATLNDTNSQRDTMGFDAVGRVVFTESSAPAFNGVAAQALRVTRTYDDENHLLTLSRLSVPDPAATGTLTTTWRYDALGRLVAEVAPDGQRDSTHYDPAGNPDQVLTRRGHTITTVYDALNRPTSRSQPGVLYGARYQGIPLAYGSGATCSTAVQAQLRTYPSLPNDGGCGYAVPADVATFSYNPATGLMETANNGDVQVSRSYNPDGSLATETQRIRDVTGTDFSKHVYQLSYTYDLDGRRASLTHPSQLAPSPTQNQTLYGYDSVTGGLAQVTDALGKTFAYTYNDQGALSAITRPAGANDSYTYDNDGQPTAVATALGLRNYTLTYDARGKVLRAVGTGPRDSVNVIYSGLGYMLQTNSVIYPATGTTPWFRGAETYTQDALSNASYVYTSGIVPALGPNGGMHQTQTSDNAVFAAGTGRLNTSANWRRVPYGDSGTRDITRTDSWSYDLAGNTEFSTQAYQSSGSCDSQSKSEADCQDLASYYAADGTLRAAEYRDREGTDGGGRWNDVFEEYRYDALGRRAWVRARVSCGGVTGSNGPAGCISTVRRTVWDGNHELYEIQMPGQDGSAYLENDVARIPIQSYTPWWPMTGDPMLPPNNYFEYDPNAHYGRVAYTHGIGTDQPLGLIRIELQKYFAPSYGAGTPVSYAPFTMSILWDWRGQTDVTVDAVTGSTQHCEAVSGTSYCVTVGGTRKSWQAYEGGSLYAKAIGWYGTVITGKRDETGTLYRRARYYDPGTGRFTQEDPIGLSGGMNLYGFGNGDAINYSDPSGLCPWCVVGAVVGAVGGAAIYHFTTPADQRTLGGYLAWAGGGAVVGGSLGLAATALAPAAAAAPAATAAGTPAVALGALKAAEVEQETGAAESILVKASEAATTAADHVEDFVVPLKHLSTAGGNYGKFAAGVDAHEVIEEALRSAQATFMRNPSDPENSFRVITNLGRVIGTKGQTAIRIIVDYSGKIWTAFPVNAH